jgi:hypothetical protein
MLRTEDTLPDSTIIRITTALPASWGTSGSIMVTKRRSPPLIPLGLPAIMSAPAEATSVARASTCRSQRMRPCTIRNHARRRMFAARRHTAIGIRAVAATFPRPRSLQATGAPAPRNRHPIRAAKGTRVTALSAAAARARRARPQRRPILRGTALPAPSTRRRTLAA